MTARTFDFQSPEFLSNPYPTYAEMREVAPVYGHREQGPPIPGTVYSTGVSWYITRYDDCKAVLRDNQGFVKDFRLAVPPEVLASLPPMPPLMASLGANLTGTEPPEHTKLRALVSKAFSPRRVAEMEGSIQGTVDRLIDAVEPAGNMEVMKDFAFPLPIEVITGMMGLPMDDAPLLKSWAEIKPPANEEQAQQVMGSLMAAKAYVEQQIEARRKEPKDDLIMALMDAEVDGERLQEIQLFSMIMMFVAAGFETTVNLIGNGLLALLRHPEQLDALRQDPGLAGSAVEEMLRFDSPLEHALIRWVSRDTELRGQHLAQGDRIVVVQAAANRDPDRFPDPDRFDIRRTDNQHLSFGHGAHYCLGAALARLEAPLALSSLLARLPGLRLAVPSEELRWKPMQLPFRGLESLPVQWG